MRIDKKIQEALNTSEVEKRARIVIFDHTESVVSFLQGATHITSGPYQKVSSEQFTEKFGFTINCAYFYRCTSNDKLKQQSINL